MKRTSIRRAAVPTAAALALGLSLSACGAGNETSSDTSNASSGSKLSGTLNGAGSSAQEAAQGAWTAGFQQANTGATVNYDPSGSGAGVEQFLAGAVNFAGSDAYLDDAELASSKKACGGKTAIEVPDYISPIALIYNLDGVDKLQLSPDTAAKIFAGKITTWDDPAIKADNPDASLPARPITAGAPLGRLGHHRRTSPTSCTRPPGAPGPTRPPRPGRSSPVRAPTAPPASSRPSRTARAPSGTPTPARPATSARPASRSARRTSPRRPTPPRRPPTSPSASPAAPTTTWRSTIDRTTTEAGAYPLVLVSYVIACPTYKDAKTADLVKGYLTYVVSADGQAAAGQDRRLGAALQLAEQRGRRRGRADHGAVAPHLVHDQVTGVRVALG